MSHSDCRPPTDVEKGKEILVGIELLCKVLQVDKALIGIESNKPDAIAHLQELTENNPELGLYRCVCATRKGAKNS